VNKEAEEFRAEARRALGLAPVIDRDRACLHAAEETQVQLRRAELAEVQLGIAHRELARLRPMESRLALSMHWGAELAETVANLDEELEGVHDDLATMWTERDEARAEAERLRAQLAVGHAAADQAVLTLRAEVERLRAELVSIRAGVSQLRWERDEARAGAKRLRDERAGRAFDALTAADELKAYQKSGAELDKSGAGEQKSGAERPEPPDLTLLLAVAEAVLDDPDASRWHRAFHGSPADSAMLCARLAEIVGRVLAARGYAMPEGKRRREHWETPDL